MARYELIREIGRGGMATIWEASRHCSSLDQVVAIKRILPELRTDESIRARFRQEAELCMQLAHPNIVQVYDLDGDKKKDLIIVMELVDGVSLERLAAKVELTPPLIRLILAHLLRALAHAHSRGILHRDISPKNILISRNGEVKLADFGLAKRIDSPCTEPGFKGTAAYASPAVIQGAEGDVYSDLYSLAAVGYWMLTKTPPYFYGNLPQIVRRMSLSSVPPLAEEETPADLRGLITALLHYTKERTFHSAEQAEAVITEHAEPMASPEELAALVRQAMNPEQPADEHVDMEQAETQQVIKAASRRRDRADAAPRAPAPQRKRWLAVAAIWLGVTCAAALWMHHQSTRSEPSTAPIVDAPVTPSIADQAPAPRASESIAPEATHEPDPTEQTNALTAPEEPPALPERASPEDTSERRIRARQRAQSTREAQPWAWTRMIPRRPGM